MPDESHESAAGLAASAYRRMADALADPGYRFTREQVVWILALLPALDWRAGHEAGYRARVEQENETYPPGPVFAAGAEIDEAARTARRRRWDATARRPRPGDHPGGPVDPW